MKNLFKVLIMSTMLIALQFSEVLASDLAYISIPSVSNYVISLSSTSSLTSEQGFSFTASGANYYKIQLKTTHPGYSNAPLTKLEILDSNGTVLGSSTTNSISLLRTLFKAGNTYRVRATYVSAIVGTAVTGGDFNYMPYQTPSLEYIQDCYTWTNSDVTVTFDFITSAGISYVTIDGDECSASTTGFTTSTNGITICGFTDELGYETDEYIEISNIDIVNPKVTLQVD